MPGEWKNQLYYGDNLNILRQYIPDESVDLIYLDPPFNSKATYNVLFAEKNGTAPISQVKAFEDFWHWDMDVEAAFQEIVTKCPKKVADLVITLRSFLGQNDMMAYLTMMTIRLVELRRVLKSTGSIYLHCDPTASHYLKLLMDSVFGMTNFRNEVVWDYSFRLMDLPHFFNRKHDILLFYAKSSKAFFNMPKTVWTKEDIVKTRKQEIHIDEHGEEWIWMPGGKGHSKNKLKKISDIIKEGKAVSDVWQISIISSSSKERLGYPTQKPESLLERIIAASSREGDTVLDPFCGCGTAIAVAEKLNRKWIGIDITHLAIALIKHRLEDSFDKRLAYYEVIGVPKDLKSAEALAQQDKYQFQWWALSLIDARPIGEQKKGADAGIDGVIYFFDDNSGCARKAIVSVKGGAHNVSQVRDLKGVMEREKAEIGIFITLKEPTKPMGTEAASAGFYEPLVYKGKYTYPRVQILTIEELLNGKQIEIPRFHIDTFKKADLKGKDKYEQDTLL